MSNEDAILEVAALIVDGVAVSEALLSDDIVEARSRAQMVATHAHAHGMHALQTAAIEVVRLLGNGSPQPYLATPERCSICPKR